MARLTRRTLLLTAALGATVARAQSVAAVRVALDGRPSASNIAFCMADEAGFYGAELLQVSLLPGGHASEAMGKLLDNRADVAIGEMQTLLRFIDENRQSGLRATLNLIDRSPYAIVARRSKGISDDLGTLIGKKLGGSPHEGALAQWPLLARLANLDLAKIPYEPLGPNVREPALISGEVDGIFGNAPFLEASLAGRGLPASDLQVLRYAEHGLDLYSSVLVASPAVMGSGDALLRFQRASIRGLRAAIADPPAAIRAVLKRDDMAQAAIVTDHFQRLLSQCILTDEVKVHGFGLFDAGRTEAMMVALSALKAFKAPLAFNDILNTDFLPERGARSLLATP